MRIRIHITKLFPHVFLLSCPSDSFDSFLAFSSLVLIGCTCHTFFYVSLSSYFSVCFASPLPSLALQRPRLFRAGCLERGASCRAVAHWREERGAHLSGERQGALRSTFGFLSFFVCKSLYPGRIMKNLIYTFLIWLAFQFGSFTVFIIL